jgi:hypothetical protein
MIWQYASESNVYVCSYPCKKEMGDHEELLINPNLNLLLISQQCNSDIKKLDLQYRFIVGSLLCLHQVHRALKSAHLHGWQVAIDSHFWKPLTKEDDRIFNAKYKDFLEHVESKFWMEAWGYKSLHFEDSPEPHAGSAMLDVVFTF